MPPGLALTLILVFLAGVDVRALIWYSILSRRVYKDSG